MKITGFLSLDGEGRKMMADTFETSVAFACFDCSHPVLATARENKRRSDEDHPAVCRRWRRGYFLDVRQPSEKIYIHGS